MCGCERHRDITAWCSCSCTHEDEYKTTGIWVNRGIPPHVCDTPQNTEFITEEDRWLCLQCCALWRLAQAGESTYYPMKRIIQTSDEERDNYVKDNAINFKKEVVERIEDHYLRIKKLGYDCE